MKHQLKGYDHRRDAQQKKIAKLDGDWMSSEGEKERQWHQGIA
jgi:hypothetical protein